MLLVSRCELPGMLFTEYEAIHIKSKSMSGVDLYLVKYDFGLGFFNLLFGSLSIFFRGKSDAEKCPMKIRDRSIQ